MRAVLKVMFFPGELVSRALGAKEQDDRVMIRTLINMLVWNAVIVIGAFLIFD